MAWYCLFVENVMFYWSVRTTAGLKSDSNAKRTISKGRTIFDCIKLSYPLVIYCSLTRPVLAVELNESVSRESCEKRQKLCSKGTRWSFIDWMSGWVVVYWSVDWLPDMVSSQSILLANKKPRTPHWNSYNQNAYGHRTYVLMADNEVQLYSELIRRPLSWGY